MKRFEILMTVAFLMFTGCAAQKGDKGDTGLTGAIGVQGPAGADGTAITVIRFCADQPSYPSSFPEVGECINGKIYGVYSVNDGFLAELPPGNYSSNAVGSACNFTIGDNCAVSR
jgi:hypothetical protein